MGARTHKSSRFTPDWDIGFSVDVPPKAVSHSRHTSAAASFFTFFVILIYYYPLAIHRKPPSQRTKKINCLQIFEPKIHKDKGEYTSKKEQEHNEIVSEDTATS